MKLHRLGPIITHDMLHDLGMRYAAVPFATQINGTHYRIFFSSRDQYNQSYGSYLDYDIQELKIIIPPPKKPLIIHGSIGYFDDSGVTISCYLKELNALYYMGWNLMRKVPFSNQIGKLELNPKEDSVHRTRKTPVLGKCELEPLSFGYPWVLKTKDKYKMWYDTILKWESNSTSNYKFILRSALSNDGVNWHKTYKQNFPLHHQEKSIARPCIIFEDNIYKMWCSVNYLGKYRLCYAESIDGDNWQRMDNSIIWKGKKQNWESTEQSYPFLIQNNMSQFLLYNGNDYGKSGFGICLVEV